MELLRRTGLVHELRYGLRSIVRENRLCARRVALLQRNERLPADELERENRRRLAASLRVAIARLPAYRRVRTRVSEDAVLEVLQNEFPVVSKEDLLERPDLYYPRGGKPAPWTIVGRTSGTTGTPLMIFRSLDSIVWENAFLRRHWVWSGFRPGMRRATLRGDLVVPVDRRVPPFWFYNRYDRQLVLSSRHLRKGCFEAIVERLASFKPYLLQAYPSTAFDLATYLRNVGLRLRIPFVYTGSEVLTALQRELIEERLGSRVMDFYGMAERVAFASECEQGNLHLNTDYAHVEILDERGEPTDDFGFVVGTTYYNACMPLVRYRLSDRTRWKPGRCACGRAYPMIEPVTGKQEDVIYGSHGDAISPSVVTFAFKGLRNIRQAQVAQIAKGHWEVRVVPFGEFGAADRRRLIENIRELVDSDLRVSVVAVPEIARTSAGKYRWVVNETKNQPERVA